MALVYLATSPSGKRYVGWTSRTLDIRIGDHMERANDGTVYKFAAALRKYRGQMKWQVLWDGLDDSTARELEIAYIRLFDSRRKGYNGTDGGDGVAGLEWSEASRKRASESGKKRFERPEEREKARLRNLGRKATAETRARQSESMRLAAQRPGASERRSETAKRVGARPEVKALLSAARKGKKRPEQGPAISARKRGADRDSAHQVGFLYVFGATVADISTWVGLSISLIQTIVTGRSKAYAEFAVLKMTAEQRVARQRERALDQYSNPVERERMRSGRASANLAVRIAEKRRSLDKGRTTNVRLLLALGATGRQCAEWFKVSDTVISYIKHGTGVAYAHS